MGRLPKHDARIELTVKRDTPSSLPPELHQVSAISDLSDAEVFTMWVSALMELRRREILRSFNTPTGDYAEWLVARTLGLTLENNSRSGFDAVGPDGTRYQIKARWLATPKSNRQLSVIRNLDADPFDYLIVVLFGPGFEITECWQIPIDVVRKHARYVAHVNGHRLLARGALLADPGTVR
ncbi:MAG: hypothetical protein M3412_01450, partial [Chloroflexota bacterium]|nr:hypothetical protein [Chloroflexota bacterium]